LRTDDFSNAELENKLGGYWQHQKAERLCIHNLGNQDA